MKHLPNRSILRLLALVAVLGLVAAACGDDDDTEATVDEDGTTTTTDAPDDGAGGDGGDGPSITIQNFDFEGGVSVAAGEPLEVVNADGVGHTLTERDGAFDTGTIDGGGSTELTVDEPGEYEIYCAIHPSMTGTLTVEGGDGDAAPATSPAEVVFEAQSSDGSSIVVASVTLPSPGFVAVHANADGSPGAVIGNTELLPAGESTDVTVELDQPLESTDLLFPMAHIDMDGDGEYLFAPPDDAVDIPAMTADGEVAVTGAEVTVGG